MKNTTSAPIAPSVEFTGTDVTVPAEEGAIKLSDKINPFGAPIR